MDNGENLSMRKLLVFLEEKDIEFIDKQIVSKFKDEVDEINAVLNTESFGKLPDNWNVITKENINGDEYLDGVYVHAVDNISPLIEKKVLDNSLAILCLDKDDYTSIWDGFDLLVFKNRGSFQSETNQYDQELNEYIIDSQNENDVEYFKHNFVESEKIELTIQNTDNNILKFSRKNGMARSVLEFLVSKDYTLVDFIENKRDIFIKREKLPNYISKSIKDLQLLESHGVFYTIEKKSKNDSNAPERLIVIFSSMPGPDEYFSEKFEERSFVKHFPTIQKLLVPNTSVLRIIDSNLIYGSHYVNSNNFRNYENIIQDIISEVSQKLFVQNNNVVLYGTSKGGTGALVHSLIGNYKSVTVDPIVDAKEYNFNMHNIHYIKGNRDQSLTKKINDLSKNNNVKNNILIRSPQVKFNYSVTEQLSDNRILFYEQINSNIKSHPEIGRNSVSEILMFLNLQLLGLTIRTEG